MKKIITAIFLTFASYHAHAAIIPVGVQNDVALSTVTSSWGWTQIYRGNYAEIQPIDSMFAGHGDYVMIASINNALNAIDVLAAVSWLDFTTYTAQNQPHLANGALWYNNGGSLGFAGLGDTINQNSADTNNISERDRLSWHTFGLNGYNGLATTVGGGWRSGNVNGLNNSVDWDRIVFTANTISNVPEPLSVVLLIVGLVGFGVSNKKFRTTYSAGCQVV